MRKNLNQKKKTYIAVGFQSDKSLENSVNSRLNPYTKKYTNKILLKQGKIPVGKHFSEEVRTGTLNAILKLAEI